ncbi:MULTISPECIES: PLAT/LH2 domain-containing protein [unclassified Bacillus (in: firmicutes)]|uniref:PLAT/LH2 domain-containing protein n=1 Tax=unclassified Bacillus (in: firmicutes) TaxID=185979 RepID=UPI00404290A2
MARYKIHFKTADEGGAGTDAAVFVRLYGKNRYVSPMFGDFDSPRDDFETGQLDIFTLPVDIPSHDICALDVRIEYDDNDPGDHPEWKLEYIKLTSDDINKEFTFPCNAWLGTKVHPHTKGYRLPEASLPEEPIPVNNVLSDSVPVIESI